MKKNLRYMAMMLAALTIGACQTDDLPDDISTQDKLPVGFYVGDDIPITMGYAYSADAEEATTRSKITGREDAVTDISLLCFDGNGYFLGKRDLHGDQKINEEEVATTQLEQYFTEQEEHRLNVEGDALFKGRIKIEIPDNTARIHIVTNRNLVMTGELIGRHVNEIMSSDDMTNTIGNSENDRVVFWGYHRENSAEAFQIWLNESQNYDDIDTVTGLDHPDIDWLYLIRARARVEIGKVLDPKVKSIRWAISRGLEKGYIAPMNRANLATDPFAGYYTGEGEQAEETATQLTPYPGGRFDAEEVDLEPITWYTEETAEAAKTEAVGSYQLNGVWYDHSNVEIKAGNVIRHQSTKKYLFEDANDNPNDPVRIILEVTYDRTKLDNPSSYTADPVKYHVLMFKDNNDKRRAIYRNRTYLLNLVRLNEDLGEKTFAEALTTDKFSNDMLNYVNQEVKNINLGGRLLQLTYGTAMLIQEGTTGTIHFHYGPTDNPNIGVAGMNMDNFHLMWTSNPDVSPDAVNTPLTYAAFTYDEATGNGSVTFNINEPSASTLRKGVIRLYIDNWETLVQGTDPINRILARNINVYTYKKFSFAEEPTLVDFGETRSWTIDYGDYTTNEQREVYKLTFKLPESYPADLLPLKIKFATSTLNAFADQEVRTGGILQPSGTFSVAPENTNNIITEPGSPNDWYYDIDNWGYWYTYLLNNIPDDRTVTIYLCDVRGKRGTSTDQRIGMLFKIELNDYPRVQLPFGNPVAIAVPTP